MQDLDNISLVVGDEETRKTLFKNADEAIDKYFEVLKGIKRAGAGEAVHAHMWHVSAMNTLRIYLGYTEMEASKHIFEKIEELKERDSDGDTGL